RLDALAYRAPGGPARALEHQAAATHNVASASTTGFRAQLAHYRSVPVVGDGLHTRVGTVAATPGASFAAGPIETTGRPLDVAIRGEGWFTVQTADGEAYTRAGNFNVGITGLLETPQGLPVLSDQNQPIAVPANAQLAFGEDGSISMLNDGDADGHVMLGRLKLVNPESETMVRGGDGLFRLNPQLGLEPNSNPDPAVRMVSGALERSNVSPVEAMVTMLDNARRFELQMKTIQHASSNAERANQLLS